MLMKYGLNSKNVNEIWFKILKMLMKYGLNFKNDLTRKRLFGYNISTWLKT